MIGELDHYVASSASVQRLRPVGGLAHAVATSRASSLPVSLRSCAAHRDAAPQGPIEIAFHEAAYGPIDGGRPYSDGPGNLLVAAADVGRQSLRAACLPPLSIAVSSSRSAWPNSTRYRTFVVRLPVGGSGRIDP